MLGLLAGRARVDVTPDKITAHIEANPDRYEQEEDTDEDNTINTAQQAMTGKDSLSAKTLLFLRFFSDLKD